MGNFCSRNYDQLDKRLVSYMSHIWKALLCSCNPATVLYLQSCAEQQLVAVAVETARCPGGSGGPPTHHCYSGIFGQCRTGAWTPWDQTKWKILQLLPAASTSAWLQTWRCSKPEMFVGEQVLSKEVHWVTKPVLILPPNIQGDKWICPKYWQKAALPCNTTLLQFLHSSILESLKQTAYWLS